MGAKEDKFNDYAGFVDKFKTKHTTDDCYTPADVYEVVKEYALQLDGNENRQIVRPFYPGGDYEHYDYPEGCLVCDNPPFSILAKIARFYLSKGIKFFLFGPQLTLFSANLDVSYIITDSSIVYENGAKIATGFITNIAGDFRIIVDNVLKEKLSLCESQKSTAKKTTKYEWPNNLVTAALLNRCSRVGVDNLYIKKSESDRISGKLGGCIHIFGGGFLISDKAAAEKAAAEKAAAKKAVKIELTEKELAIIKRLSN